MKINYYTLRNQIKHSHTPIQYNIYESFLNLSDESDGPLIAKGVLAAYNQVDDCNIDSLPIQFHPASKFRSELATSLGLAGLDIEDPRKLPIKFQTEKWEKLNYWLNNYSEFDEEKKYRIVTLLNRMGFYSITLDMIPDFDLEEISKDVMKARFAGKRQMALYKTKNNHNPKLDILSTVAKSTHQDFFVKLGAAISLIVDSAKRKDLESAKRWSLIATEEFKRLNYDKNPVSYIQASCYFRAIAYIPFLEGDIQSLEHYMNLAYSYGNRFPKNNLTQQIIFKENLHPYYETSIKCSIWKKDIDEALDYSQKLIKLDPLDPKVYLHSGDVYRLKKDFLKAKNEYMQAYWLGYPFSNYSAFMIGYCYESVNLLEEACEWYTKSLEHEPNGISVLERLKFCSKKIGNTYLNNFAIRNLNEIDKMKKQILKGRG